jgi:hypothetical protein
MARRILSILLYLIGGVSLFCEAVLAFGNAEFGTSKLIMVAVFVPPALLGLGLGTLASPGARRRELGIVLLALPAAMLILILSLLALREMPRMAELLPLDMFDILNDHRFGFINLAAIAALG